MVALPLQIRTDACHMQRGTQMRALLFRIQLVGSSSGESGRFGFMDFVRSVQLVARALDQVACLRPSSRSIPRDQPSASSPTARCRAFLLLCLAGVCLMPSPSPESELAGTQSSLGRATMNEVGPDDEEHRMGAHGPDRYGLVGRAAWGPLASWFDGLPMGPSERAHLAHPNLNGTLDIESESSMVSEISRPSRAINPIQSRGTQLAPCGLASPWNQSEKKAH